MARLRAMARTDGLLGIANRAHFHERLEQVCALALRGERPVGVLMVDVDFFKAFNDHYGHLHGDACLQKIAKALTGCLYRTSDLVARYGGEELVVLLPDTNLAGAQQVAQRMVEAVAQLPEGAACDAEAGGFEVFGEEGQDIEAHQAISRTRPAQRRRAERPR